MFEIGLSVSVESSPRTPLSSGINNGYGHGHGHGRSGFFGNMAGLLVPDAPLKKKIQNPRVREIYAGLLGRELTESDEEVYSAIESQDDTDTNAVVAAAVAAAVAECEEEQSVSPRVLFESHLSQRDVARRLEFGGDLSPIPVATSSLSCEQTFVTTTMSTKEPDNIGDCSVCYQTLPLRSNHVFTICGHLFCVRCLLIWWDTATTCPMCRADILEEEKVEERPDVSHVNNAQPPPVVHEVDDSDDHDEHDSDDDIESIHSSSSSSSDYIGRDDEHENLNDDLNDVAANAERGRVHQDITLINQYLHQDDEWDWSGAQNPQSSNPYSDDTVYHLNYYEILGLRENREAAISIFARMRFRETLLSSESIRSLDIRMIQKHEWSGIMTDYQRSLPSIENVLYEFVIKKHSIISPTFEVSVFGFIKDVLIVPVDHENTAAVTDDVSDYDWEQLHEYIFVANVFTPSDFYIENGSNVLRGFGEYNMTEGTITTEELYIPFSQIRRLYRMEG